VRSEVLIAAVVALTGTARAETPRCLMARALVEARLAPFGAGAVQHAAELNHCVEQDGYVWSIELSDIEEGDSPGEVRGTLEVVRVDPLGSRRGSWPRSFDTWHYTRITDLAVSDLDGDGVAEQLFTT